MTPQEQSVEVPAEAVDLIARREYQASCEGMGYPAEWSTESEQHRELWREPARAHLIDALPAIHADVRERRRHEDVIDATARAIFRSDLGATNRDYDQHAEGEFVRRRFRALAEAALRAGFDAALPTSTKEEDRDEH